MDGRDPPAVADLPSLPHGCEELQLTASPTRDRLLNQYLDELLGLDQPELDCLHAIATNSGSTTTDPKLELSDLLRARRDGSHALHPRVVHLLPPNTVDSLLARLVDLVDEHIGYEAYQYPDYLAECDSGSPLCASMYPQDYRIDVIDLVRDLRANDILTSVRERGQSARGTASLEAMVEQLKSMNEPVEGVTTLLRADEGGKYERPLLVVEDHEGSFGRRSPEELLRLCETLKSRFDAPVSIQVASQLAIPRDSL